MLAIGLFWWFFNFSKPEQPASVPANIPKVYTQEERQKILLEAGFIPVFRPYPTAPEGEWKFLANKFAKEEKKTLNQFLKEQQKPIILHVWAHWCGPCKRELPIFAAFAAKQDKVAIISMVSSDPDKIWEFYNSRAITNLNLAVDHNNVISKALTIRSIPTTILINKAGQVIGKIIGTFPWDDQEKTDALIQALVNS